MTGSHLDPSFDARLWNFARGVHDAEMEQHVATCGECQDELATLRHLVRYQRVTGGDMPDPPAALHTSLTGLLGKVRPDLVPRRTSVLDRARETLRRITAELILDSDATPQLAGLRGGTDHRTRQLAFVSDLADLDLEVTREDGANAVAGQLGMDTVPSGLVIEFAPADPDVTAPAAEARIEEDGHFTLVLPPGDWVASVRIDDAVLIFPGVRL